MTTATPAVQQQSSSVSSGFISNMLNPNPYTGINSILNLNTESTSLVDVPVTTNTEMPHSSIITLPPPPIPIFQLLQQTPVPTPIIIPSTSLQNLPNFGSLFKFEDRVTTLEKDFSEFKQTNQFAEAVSLIPGVIDNYLASKLNEAVKVAVQLQSEKLREEAQAKNEAFINKIDENMKKIIKEQVKEQVKAQVSKILPKIKKAVKEQLESKVLSHSSNKSKTSHAIAANLSELELKKILIDKIERNKSIYRSDEQKNLLTPTKVTNSYLTHIEILSHLKDVEMMRIKTKNPLLDQTGGPREEELEKNKSQPVHQRKRTLRQLASLLKDSNLITREFNLGFTEDQPIDETTQHHDYNLARKEDTHDSFNELMDTPLDFLAFVMNQLKVDTLTPELLVGPTFELMKGLCKSLVELEYFLKEVYKETTDQLDWNNLESQQYPHDLRKPLPLIPNSQGRHVIPFDHFINNDLAYLRGGTSSRTYATSVRKTKAADYGHVKWIKDLNALLNVSLRMFTRSIFIQRRVEDLQLGVESYQKKLNLIRPNTYRSNLKRFPNYSAYPNPRGFIYQNKDKKNKLMRIDELHKFSDGTLNDVRTALDDILKRIRMKYLPLTY
ncbi:hypothetical protein Tco_1437289 [Tanacetum coccineum]